MNLSPNNETLSEKSFISNTFTEINIKKETDTSFRSLHPKLQNGPKSKFLKGNKTFEEELISRKLLQRKISLDNICLKNFSASFLFCFGGLAFLAKHFQKNLMQQVWWMDLFAGDYSYSKIIKIYFSILDSFSQITIVGKQFSSRFFISYSQQWLAKLKWISKLIDLAFSTLQVSAVVRLYGIWSQVDR